LVNTFKKLSGGSQKRGRQKEGEGGFRRPDPPIAKPRGRESEGKAKGKKVTTTKKKGKRGGCRWKTATGNKRKHTKQSKLHARDGGERRKKKEEAKKKEESKMRHGGVCWSNDPRYA